jgi:hypothetical protein
MVGWSAGWSAGGKDGQLVGRSEGRPAGRMVSSWVGWRAGWSAHGSAGGQDGQLVGQLAGRMVCCWVGWLARMVRWLVGVPSSKMIKSTKLTQVLSRWLVDLWDYWLGRSPMLLTFRWLVPWQCASVCGVARRLVRTMVDPWVEAWCLNISMDDAFALCVDCLSCLSLG